MLRKLDSFFGKAPLILNVMAPTYTFILALPCAALFFVRFMSTFSMQTFPTHSILLGKPLVPLITLRIRAGSGSTRNLQMRAPAFKGKVLGLEGDGFEARERGCRSRGEQTQEFRLGSEKSDG